MPSTCDPYCGPISVTVVVSSTISSLATGQHYSLLFYFSRGCHRLVCTGSHHPHQISLTNHLSGKYFSVKVVLLRLSIFLWTWRWKPATYIKASKPSVDCYQEREMRGKAWWGGVVVVSPSCPHGQAGRLGQAVK